MPALDIGTYYVQTQHGNYLTCTYTLFRPFQIPQNNKKPNNVN